MIGSSFRGNNQMIYFLTYVFLACMLFCIFSQLHFLAGALKFFDALYVVPVFQVSAETVAMTDSSMAGADADVETDGNGGARCSCSMILTFRSFAVLSSFFFFSFASVRDCSVSLSVSRHLVVRAISRNFRHSAHYKSPSSRLASCSH